MALSDFFATAQTNGIVYLDSKKTIPAIWGILVSLL